SGVSQTSIRIAITEKGGRLVRDDCARFTSLIDFNHAINLMTALIVFKRERLTVFAPNQVRQFVWIRKECVIDVDLLARRNLKQHRLLEIEYIAGFSVNDG